MDKSNEMPEARGNGFFVEISPSLILLIGGASREKGFSDIWLLDTKNKKWLPLTDNPLTEKITSRIGVAGIISTSADNSITLFLHGGQDFFTKTFYADMFEITIPTNKEVNSSFLSSSTIKNHTLYPLDITKNPCERNSHCIIFNGDELLYIFGGGNKDGLLNDLWSFNIKTKSYEKISIEDIENIIAPRELFAMAYNKAKNSLIIMGGRLYESIDNYSYIIDLNTKKCMKGKKMPTALCAFAFTKAEYNKKEYIIMYGGTNGNKFFNSFVVYDIALDEFYVSKLIINKELVNNDPTFAVFLGRISAMMTYNGESGNIILYGGSASDKEWSYINIIPLKDILNI